MKKSHLFVLMGILGCLLLTVVFSACRVVDASTIPPAKEVRMGTSDFIDKEVTINKGESVNLVATTSSNHVISNGTWENGAQVKKAEANAPVVSSQNVAGGASLTIGPFPVAGDYNYYCTIHPGMKLVVHVK
jgi:plastocyanin